MNTPRYSKALGVFFAVIAAIGFSGKAVLVKLAYLDGIDAISLLALRMLFSVPIFLLAAAWSNRRSTSHLNRKDWLLIIVLGILGYYLSSLFDFMGLAYISAGLERLILFLYPTMVLLLSALFFRRRIHAYQVVAIALCYSGILLAYLHEGALNSSNPALGAFLVFLGSLTYAGYLIGTGEMIHRIGAMRFTAYAMLVASIATLAQFALTHNALDLIDQTPRVYMLSVLMAVFSTILPVFLLSAGIKSIGAGNAAMIGSIGPIATIAMAAYFLGEPVTLFQILGSALVLIGVLWISVNARKG